MQPLSRRVNPFDLAGLAKEKQELEEQMAQDGFWNDVENANKVNQRIKAIHAKLDKYRKLETTGEDVSTLFDMAEEEDDEETALEAQAELKEFLHKVEEFRIDTMLRGPYDNANAVLSLHAGAGGTEAQDWVSLLYRMYTRYCERKGFVVKELDLLDGEEAGIKSVTFECQGDNAYGYLKAEKGVHRLVRISPFDSSGRRHTSFASLDVTPILDDDAGDIEINPDDIRVDTYRSSGAGGQHINKTESAIRITHKPTGIVVTCQDERSQHKNKETAMKVLKSKLVEIAEREQKDKIDDLKGVQTEIAWGNQIRSYVFHPYSMVKDHRTNYETGNINAVMNGDIDGFINAYLKAKSKGEI